jgi:hypothetical protein
MPAWKKATFWEKLKAFFRRGYKQEFLVGSHNKIRFAKKHADTESDLYWRATYKYNLKETIRNISKWYSKHMGFCPDVVLYAEIIGPKIQVGYDYGIPKGNIEMAVFDMMVNGRYLEWDELDCVCRMFELPMVEVVHKGPWSLNVVNLAQAVDEYGNGKFKREGIVVRACPERKDPKCGRVIFKCINPDYLLDKKNSDWH